MRTARCGFPSLCPPKIGLSAPLSGCLRRQPAQSRFQISRGQNTCSQSLAAVAPQYSTVEQKVGRQAILLQRFKGHQSTVTSVLVASDIESSKQVVTASLDKSVALWDLPVSESHEPSKVVEKARISPEGSPTFSLVQEPPSYESARNTVFCGVAARSVMTWDLNTKSADKKVKLNGHTGWVRALATNHRWLFSAGCNKIAQWDLSRSVPRKFNEITLYTGDIQGLCYGDGLLVSCGADGSLHSWTLGKKGELEPAASRLRAHEDRISNCVYIKGFVYTVSLDGTLKMWSAKDLELVHTVSRAHNGGKVHCLAAGPDGNLYTGGEDKLIRRWDVGSLQPGGALYGHHYAIRALASGNLETLVSADSSGEVAIWRV